MIRVAGNALVEPAKEACGEGAELAEVIKKNAELTAEALAQKSGIIGAALEAGKVCIVPAYYELASGRVNFL